MTPNSSARRCACATQFDRAGRVEPQVGQLVRGDHLGRPLGGTDVLDGARSELVLECPDAGRVGVAEAQHVGGGRVVLLGRHQLRAPQTGESERAELDQQQQVVPAHTAAIDLAAEVEQALVPAERGAHGQDVLGGLRTEPANRRERHAYGPHDPATTRCARELGRSSST